MLHRKENKDQVPVTRDDQLTMKKPVERTKGKGRGKGRGKGQGRGGRGRGGSEKADSKASSSKATSTSATTSQKRKQVEDKGNTTRRSKKPKAQPDYDCKDWDWEDYEENWDEHWWENYEEGEWEGWNNQEKMWDKAAWHDGKASLHELSTADSSKANNKSKTSKAVDKDSATKKAQDDKDKESKKGRKRPTTDKDEEPDTTAAPESSSAAEPLPAPKAKAKAKAETKKRAKTSNDPSAASQPEPKSRSKAAKAKAQPKQAASRPAQNSPLLDTLAALDMARRGSQRKALEESMIALRNLASKFMEIENREDFDEQEMRKKLRKKILSTEEFTMCSFNIYWKRPAVGVTSKEEKKDFAYFTIPNSDQNRVARMAIALKSAVLMVSSTHCACDCYCFSFLYYAVVQYNYQKRNYKHDTYLMGQCALFCDGMCDT